MFLKRVRNLRDEQDLTQIKLAKILGVSKSTYSRWETDEEIITLNHLNDLCNYFNVTMDYMIGFNNEKNYSTSINKKLNKILIGNRLRQFRKDNKLTQEKLAAILNTSHSTISAYENGKTMILTAFAYDICKKYHLSLDYFCGRTDKNLLK